VAYRTAGQLVLRRRIEAGIRLFAPALDLFLFAGDQVSRVAGRDRPRPTPPARLEGRGARTRIGGPVEPPGPSVGSG
jgi:hypothetical protein